MYLAKQYLHGDLHVLYIQATPTIFAMDEKVYGLDGKVAVLS